jgi:hypothetical protein
METPFFSNRLAVGNAVVGAWLKVYKEKDIAEDLDTKKICRYLKKTLNCGGNVLIDKELGEIIHHDWKFEPVPDKPELYQMVDDEPEEDKKHNRKVFDRATEIENEEWKEIWKILEGQDHGEYKKLYDSQTEEEKHSRDLWKDWFDGSGMKHWWD